ncbi:MAG TPA: energy transducer TonB [Rhodanobacteraceae bacterium]|nr:energy transducer TonB [Rhodanobacteraceae bacterium]
MNAPLAVFLLAALSPFAALAADHVPPMATMTISVSPYPPPRELFPDEDPTPHYGTRWAVSLDAEGRVAKLEAVDKTPEAIRVPLDAAIRKWQFMPGTVNGQPVPTDTMLTLDVTLVPAGEDKYALRVDDARTGGAVKSKDMHGDYPKYPSNAVRHHRQGLVVLRVDYDAKGHVLAAKRQADAPAVADDLEVAAARAVKSWWFTPEVVGGHALAGSAIVPICFELVGMGKEIERANCNWAPQGVKSLQEGGVVAIEPAARLKTDIVGHTL